MNKKDKIAVILTILTTFGILAGLVLFCIFPEIGFLIVIGAIFYSIVIDGFIREILYPTIRKWVYKRIK